MFSDDWWQLQIAGVAVMPNNVSQVQVKRERGVLKLVGFAQTPRGQKFVKGSVTLVAEKIADKNFKSDLATAMEKLLA